MINEEADSIATMHKRNWLYRKAARNGMLQKDVNNVSINFSEKGCSIDSHVHPHR